MFRLVIELSIIILKNHDNYPKGLNNIQISSCILCSWDVRKTIKNATSVGKVAISGGKNETRGRIFKKV